MKILEIYNNLLESELKFFDNEKGHYSLSGRYVFIRFGLPNMDNLGNYKKSYCYVGGKDKLYEESGISVFEAFKVKGKNKYYILGGGHILNTSYDELNNTNSNANYKKKVRNTINRNFNSRKNTMRKKYFNAEFAKMFEHILLNSKSPTEATIKIFQNLDLREVQDRHQL
jgi:hypothetical protein